MNSLINVNEGYIPNLRPLGPLLHVEKFVVGGGGWKTKFSVHLSPKLNNRGGGGQHFQKDPKFINVHKRYTC